MLNELVESLFKVEESEGEDKVMSLEQAIRRNVKPGMSLFIQHEASAAICELVRQFWGKKPEFTLITTEVFDQMTTLIHCGLLKKLIFAVSGYLFPSSAPNKIIQRAFKQRSVEFENWSLDTIQQRLMAGAMNTEFMVTKSVIGTSLAEENKDSIKLIDDPFGSGKKVGVVKAFNPDIAIIHALAADCYGNTMTLPISEDTLWGPRASRNGVVVTVERIVSTDFIRRHSSLVKIPGHIVKSVSLVPFGAHPQGVIKHDLEGFESYADDNEFKGSYHHQASQSTEAMDAWIKEWILDCRTHQDYLHKLGNERLLSLRGRGGKDAWKHELESLLENISTSEEYNPREMMAVVAARKIKERVLQHNRKLLLVGAGMPALAAWPAYYQLKKLSYHIDAVVGDGQFGYLPLPPDPNFVNPSIKSTCKILSDVFEMYSVIIGGQGGNCLSVLGAGQIDKYGNLNFSKVDDVYLTGAGGANDNTSLAQEVLIVVPQSPSRFVKQLSYLTCRGDKVKTVVSTMAVFEKIEDNKELTLTQYFPDPKLKTREEHIRRIKENCGWDLKVSQDVEETSPPTQEELLILRLFDPKRYLIK